ncbi:DNA-binding protein D-ETS-4 [Nasonia vitripennis]|uniref:DNA-binding protein D-ETS-4 n=1 Tax=Nasonia vitripennis TaxID=7425 RepID=A0A7M7GC45_NASVI|nr:DNA-binding protein D-ETS-4 [Nasonia vitripennis]
MPQTVPTATSFSPSFDYSTFQFDLSLLSDDYTTSTTTTSNNSSANLAVSHQPQDSCGLKAIKLEVQSPGSPSCNTSPPYAYLPDELSPNYSRDASPAYPLSPYYVPQSPQSAQLYPTSPESAGMTSQKQPVKREKSFDLLAILHESRLLAESLGYKEDSTDCTVPCTPPPTEEDIYNSLDTDFFPKKDESNPLLKEILFREDTCLSPASSIRSSVTSSPGSTSSLEPENRSSLRDLLFRNTGKDSANLVKTDLPSKQSDHQLLREVLRDTSFQRKYNLKPVELGAVGTGFVEDMVAQSGECVGDLAREQIEPVLSLAIQQLQKDFDNTCVALGIHPEPRRWSTADVAAWVQWAKKQLQLPTVPLECFNIDGVTLVSLSEEEFCRRAPQCGSMLHAQLEIWKAAVEDSPRNTAATTWTPTAAIQPPEDKSSTPSVASNASPNVKDSLDMDFSDDEDEDASSTDAKNGSGGSVGKIRSSGSHIHLWQFLKELLQSPGSHGSCIRWLDRNKGVFKIEDSVRVARLWGKRKNRPAMNYDKLSRSIRQYYKKGIMKKTERSQRLVYQFCHPYCL